MRPVLLTLLILCATAALADEPPPPAVGAQAPEFALFDMHGACRRLSDFHEPVIVINFWAFWCDTWKAQLPQLRELAGQQGDLSFRLLAISVDGQWSTRDGSICAMRSCPSSCCSTGGARWLMACVYGACPP